MNVTIASLCLLTTAHAFAQGEAKVPQPFPTLPATKEPAAVEPATAVGTPPPFAATSAPTQRPNPSAGEPALPTRRGVLFDARTEGTWAVADTWKASFDPTGVTFLPFLGASAPRNLPVHFALHSVSIGGKALPIAAASVHREGAMTTLDHGFVQERYAAQPAGLEQSFVFATLPQRDELCISVGMTGEFAVQATDAGFVLQHDLGSFTYGKAIAIDAVGKHLDLVTAWNGNAFTTRVPASFVRDAVLPLVIDPLIGNVTTVQSASVPVSSSDIAYDATLHQFVVSWDWTFSQTDTDVFAQRYDEDLNPIGQVLVVDSSTASWRNSRIAGLNLYDKFLVVAECRTAVGATPIVRGVLIEGATGSTSIPLTLVSGPHALLTPDVGGDPVQIGPTYFTVVFEREWSPTDHDIQYVQVDSTGAVRGPAANLDASNAYEHSPRISKSNGQGGSQQFWAVVYRRDQGTTGQTRGALITWDGHLQVFGTAGTLPLANYAAPAGNIGLDVSSPTDDGRFLAVDTLLDPASTNRYLRGLAFDHQLTVLANGGMSYPAAADYEPALDCDGTRFVMAFLDNHLTTDLVAATYDLVGPQILRREAIYMTQTAAFEHTGGIVAMHSGGAGYVGDREYAVTWTTNASPGGSVLAQRYHGIAPGGFGFRANGCGALSWSVHGEGAIGEVVSLQLLNTAGLCGWAFGAPISVPLGFCPGCTQGTTADVVLGGGVLQWQIPRDPYFVGTTFALQGFDFAAGTCLGSLALSHTVDLTIR